MRCTELLKSEHHLIVRALDVLDRMAAETEQGQAVEPEDVQAILRFLRKFADDQHQTKEEFALFPALLHNDAIKTAPLHQMIFEHDQERSLVEGLEEALHTKKGADFTYFAHRLTALIRSHIHKEDDALFRIADQLLTEEEDQRITRELNKFEIDRNLIADLQRLEWVYLGRAA
jgi:hemerythrin-like domain-containing protein